MEDASVDQVMAELNVKIFLAHAEALEKLGAWDEFARRNQKLLDEVAEKLEL